MKRVFVDGWGVHPFGRFADATVQDLAATTLAQLLEVRGGDLSDVDEVLVANAFSYGSAAELVSLVGLTDVPVVRVEQACASGGSAVRLACDLVSSGVRQAVLVVGVERMPPGLLEIEEPDSYVVRTGLDVRPLLYGLKARQYIDAYGYQEADLAKSASKARYHGAECEHASATAPMAIEAILADHPVASPLTRAQCTRSVDGAASVVITSAPRQVDPLAMLGWIGASTAEDPHVGMRGGRDSREAVVERMVDRLETKCGIRPSDCGLFQVSDAFSIAEPLYLEALGLCAPGEGLGLVVDGATSWNGPLPTNTGGGVLGRGHALGATGVAQIVEVASQMTASATGFQLARPPDLALVQNHGRSGENIFILGGR